jgi:hypothetical protein
MADHGGTKLMRSLSAAMLILFAAFGAAPACAEGGE